MYRSPQSPITPSRLHRPVGVFALVVALLVIPSEGWAGDTWYSCKVNQLVMVFDSDKFDDALKSGRWTPGMSEVQAQKALLQLGATARRCWLKPGEKVHLLNTDKVRPPLGLAFSDKDESCRGVVLGRSALACGAPSDKPVL